MTTVCTETILSFQAHNGRLVQANFDGGAVTSDGGALLLREADLSASLTERFAACFEDHRSPARVQHSLLSLLRQRVYGMALGYSDVNDHEALRFDAMFHLLTGEADLSLPLAGKSTLNRFEVSVAAATPSGRYHKIAFHQDRFHALMRALFFEAHQQEAAPAEVVLDLDATDLELHGNQEGRFFHGFYDEYCYLPLYIFCGDHLLHAELRPADRDAATGSVEALAPIVADIRRRWPKCRIIIRADSGFCRDWLMAWCEENGVSYILGLAQNKRLLGRCARQMEKARRRSLITGAPARVYTSIHYRTLGSWSCSRRVVAKCEHLCGRANPRFVVTNLGVVEMGDADLYELGYCRRGDAENRIGEQMELFADRVSCTAFGANQLRLSLSAMAYTLMGRLRQALKGTEMERARPETIRLRLLKIGARVITSARRVVLSLASGHPWATLVRRCAEALRKTPIPKTA